MRKMLLSVVASSALIAIAPASALAHGKHHKRHHHRSHHAQVHHRSFGSDQGGVTSQNQNAGTVQSFTNGVLTILLNNGQTVSGQVTGDTEIKCETADEMSGSMRSNDRHGDSGSGDNGDQGDDQGQGDDDNNGAMCDSSDLTTGTVVHEAELRVSSAGAVWDKVELVTASAANNNNNDNDNDDD